MPSHYNDDEYKGSEHATDVFRAPKKEKTAGQKLEESGKFIQDPEKEDLSQQVNYSTMEESYAKERRPGFDKEMQAIGKAKAAGNLTDQELIEAHKRAGDIRKAEDEIDPETGWPMYLAKGIGWSTNKLGSIMKTAVDTRNPLWLMEKYGQAENWLDDQVGIPGTDIDWYHARQKILKPAYETHLALGILGDIFLPTSIDLALWGSTYIPNRFRQAGKVGLRTWASITKAGKTADEINIAKKGAEKFANFQGKDVEKVWQQEGLMMAIKPDPDDYINPMRQPETPTWVRSALGNAGIREDGTFIFDKYLENRKSLKPSDRRGLAGVFMTDPPTGFTGPNMDKALKNYTNLEKAKFMKIYTPEFLKKYDIDPKQIQLHHINALLGSLPLYDGVKYLSPEWMEIKGTLLQKNVHAGNSLKNLRFLVGRSTDYRTPHGITHKYLDEVAGPDGQTLFTPTVRENMRTLKGPYEAADGKTYKSYRSYMADKWADVTNKANDITDQASGIFDAVNADLLHLKPENIEQIMQSIGRLEADGLVKPSVIEGRFQLDPKDIKSVIFDMDFNIEIGQYFPNARGKDLSALKDAISSDNPVSAYKAIKAQLPQQLQLFSNTKIKKLNKKYRRHRNPKWDIPDIPDEPIGIDTGELDEFGKPKY